MLADERDNNGDKKQDQYNLYNARLSKELETHTHTGYGVTTGDNETVSCIPDN